MRIIISILLSFTLLVTGIPTPDQATAGSSPETKSAEGENQYAAEWKITGLIQTAAWTDQAAISWDYVPGNSTIRYDVMYSRQRGGPYYHADEKHSDVRSNQLKIARLNAGSIYYVKICAWNEAGGKIYKGDWSEPLQIVTAPAGMVNKNSIRQTNATENTISLSWEKIKNISGYRIVCKYGNTAVKELYTRSNTVKIGGLQRGRKYHVHITPYQKSSEGFTAVGEKSTYTGLKPTLPGKTKISKMELDPEKGELDIVWEDLANADGYQYRIETVKGKKVLSGESPSYYAWNVKSGALKKYQFFRVKVRAYTELGTKRKYAAWSSYRYIARQPGILDCKVTGKQIKVSWNKVEGADNYTVYISARPNSGYKKALTTKKNHACIKKYGKKVLKNGKKYFVYVTANKKYEKKKWKSTVKEHCEVVFRRK